MSGMSKWAGRVAFVTGAACGIGAAISRELVKHGLKVVGCDIDGSRLSAFEEELNSTDSPGIFRGFQCDLSKEEEIVNTFAKIKQFVGGVDVCVNSAGVGFKTPILTGDTSQMRYMFDVNVMAYVVCAREAVKQMKERNVDDGQIILINSGAGFSVRPNKPDFHFYCMTKYAVTAMAEGLRHELFQAKSHIRVGMICPGIVETEFTHRMYPGEEANVDALYKSMKVLSAQDIAEACVYILSAPPYAQVRVVHVQGVEEP